MRNRKQEAKNYDRTRKGRIIRKHTFSDEKKTSRQRKKEACKSLKGQRHEIFDRNFFS